METSYEPYSCLVRDGYEKDESFDIKTEVKQGSVPSPLLFIPQMCLCMQMT